MALNPSNSSNLDQLALKGLKVRQDRVSSSLVMPCDERATYK